jgi:hypothetical protein
LLLNSPKKFTLTKGKKYGILILEIGRKVKKEVKDVCRKWKYYKSSEQEADFTADIF